VEKIIIGGGDRLSHQVVRQFTFLLIQFFISFPKYFFTQSTCFFSYKSIYLAWYHRICSIVTLFWSYTINLHHVLDSYRYNWLRCIVYVRSKNLCSCENRL